ncbi:putative nucleotidyltransferase with HDIG domain [Desulfobaculum xiamenense]|uniref:Putative nucleotidyltransferase with HDIG domain n=1 Tax=Desulfobaculum xiamenense TaxID=995050 RepID=A0A846QH09_9BACT|nr:HD domain-containing phosphohydrolase [Desulfobaculum xiamenense]NJB67568.1 putative nucleotidyltransferase with HDIG domain [Desulfobaculum xiamenense]
MPTSTTLRRPATSSRNDSYIAVSPLMIYPGCMGRFSVYLRQADGYVLYASGEECFTERHRRALYDHGVTEVFIRASQAGHYHEYVERNLGTILMNETVPLPERAKLFHGVSLDIVKEAFETRLPDSVARKESFNRIIDFVNQGIQFLTLENSFKAVAQLVEHDYKTYAHCMHVFLYSTAILQSYGFDEELLVQCGLGAMLHDIGKTVIPENILNKPGALSSEERTIVNTHPVQGIGLCAQLPLSQTTYNCILFHHERMDGSGYPGGIRGYDIPIEARAVAIADVYDALTSDRPYAKAMNPFQVLRLMRDQMSNEIDLEMYKRFVQILSGADVL